MRIYFLVFLLFVYLFMKSVKCTKISYGNFEYFIATDPRNGVRSYAEAETSCARSVSRNIPILAIPKTQEEFRVISNAILSSGSRHFFYFGLTRPFGHIWSDNTVPTYTAWANGQPNAKFACVAMGVFSRTVQWIAVPCTEPLDSLTVDELRATGISFPLQFICQSNVAGSAATFGNTTDNTVKTDESNTFVTSQEAFTQFEMTFAQTTEGQGSTAMFVNTTANTVKTEESTTFVTSQGAFSEETSQSTKLITQFETTFAQITEGQGGGAFQDLSTTDKLLIAIAVILLLVVVVGGVECYMKKIKKESVITRLGSVFTKSQRIKYPEIPQKGNETKSQSSNYPPTKQEAISCNKDAVYANTGGDDHNNYANTTQYEDVDNAHYPNYANLENLENAYDN